jgi:hypothetical protein
MNKTTLLVFLASLSISGNAVAVTHNFHAGQVMTLHPFQILSM